MNDGVVGRLRPCPPDMNLASPRSRINVALALLQGVEEVWVGDEAEVVRPGNAAPGAPRAACGWVRPGRRCRCRECDSAVRRRWRLQTASEPLGSRHATADSQARAH